MTTDTKPANDNNVVDIKTKKPIEPKTGGPDVVETDPSFWPYLAGLIDADGTIVWSIRPRKPKKRGPAKMNRSHRISVTMCDLDILENIHYMTGMGAVYLERLKGVNGGTMDVYRWSVQKRADLQFILPLIYPFMGARKSAKLIELQALMVHWTMLAGEAATARDLAKQG